MLRATGADSRSRCESALGDVSCPATIPSTDSPAIAPVSEATALRSIYHHAVTLATKIPHAVAVTANATGDILAAGETTITLENGDSVHMSYEESGASGKKEPWWFYVLMLGIPLLILVGVLCLPCMRPKKKPLMDEQAVELEPPPPYAEREVSEGDGRDATSES